jgi:predicted DNA-binding transcriptional regulator AlpA|tara:strand:- start:83 stop:301 length:219 start_codon:yes stop_codon:yes gene_type:complete
MEYKILEELNDIKSMIKQSKKLGYMDMKQVVQYSSTSASTIRRAIAKGELKCSKKLGKLLFKVEWVDRWLNG